MTKSIPPQMFRWDGEAMVPHHPRLADRYFTVHEEYRLAIEEERSTASHNHQFAEITEAWKNLPEHLALEFPTSEMLRKHALIKAGYCDKQSFVCSSKAEAVRMAAFLRPIDEYAIVDVSGPVVTRYTAQSQSMKAMGKQVFQASKTAVLDIVSAMVGVTPAQIKHEAGRAA